MEVTRIKNDIIDSMSSLTKEQESIIELTKTLTEHDGTIVVSHPASVTDLDFEEGRTPIPYSKCSIFFAVLFFSLAIRIGAYNNALMGQLHLLLTAQYSDTRGVAIQSQLANAFIISLTLGMLAFSSSYSKVFSQT